ncbi:MAG: S1 RNA-binding domain-containing protein, partial [Planctomycetota bacterium]
GNVLEATTVYPHPPQNQGKEARQTIRRLVEEHGLKVVAIGDGTGAQETETLIGGLIEEGLSELRYTVLSEVGLDTYADSRAARNELPELDPGERYAVALGRRLQDPLAELVKVNPRELCPDSYADDVNGGALKKLLDGTIEECVCKVGVEANSANSALLRYVSGLGPEKAVEVVEYRSNNGALRNRQNLRDVPKIDQDSYDKAVGFIKVEGSDNPLDKTRIHPRFYPVAQEICSQLDIPLESLATEEGRQQVRDHSSEVKLTDLEKQFDVHYLLLKDIVAEMCDPWPDPREEGHGPVLRQRHLTIEELEPDQWFRGTVRNIVDFGVFVDIGIGEDGLVHISELSDKFVETPYDVVSVGDIVRVRVVRVDQEKGRIALSMRSESSRRGRPSRPKRQPREARQAAGQEAGTPSTPVPDERPASAVQTPKSTVGSQSRRVQKASLDDRLSKTQQQILRKQEGAPGPAPGEAQEKTDEEKEEGGVGNLIEKLGFAAIERRGEHSD